MEAKKNRLAKITPQETQLIEKLRKHPQIRERVQKILEIAGDEDSLKRADQIEELLIEEMRRLGSATMHEWASQAQEKTGQDLQSKDPAVLKRKKKR
jgi:hypothetical protein